MALSLGVEPIKAVYRFRHGWMRSGLVVLASILLFCLTLFWRGWKGFGFGRGGRGVVLLNNDGGAMGKAAEGDWLNTAEN